MFLSWVHLRNMPQDAPASGSLRITWRFSCTHTPPPRSSLPVSPPQPSSSNPESHVQLRVDEGKIWARRLACQAVMHIFPTNWLCPEGFWKPQSHIRTSWSLFLKPTCPQSMEREGNEKHPGKKYRLLCSRSARGVFGLTLLRKI